MANDLGEFRLSHLPPGEYYVVAHGPLPRNIQSAPRSGYATTY
jgi:hypothetical protein